jgi:hypothetical protein
VYKGTNAEGAVVADLEAPVVEGKWEVKSYVVLAEGTFTAVASEPSSLGGEEGKSDPVTFAVLAGPRLQLYALPTPSEASPVFSGWTTETVPVVVRVYSGAKAEGSPVEALEAPVSNHMWEVRSSTLEPGEYTAIASEESSFSNAPLTSNAVTFIVDAEPPTLTLDPLPTRSRDARPVFTGTTNQTLPVTVEIYAGVKPEGIPVQTVEAPGIEGKWTTKPLCMPLQGGVYTAVAREESSFGGGLGTSAPDTFEIVRHGRRRYHRCLSTPELSGL